MAKEIIYKGTNLKYVKGKEFMLFDSGVLIKKDTFQRLDEDSMIEKTVKASIAQGKDIYDYEVAKKTGFLRRKHEKVAKPAKEEAVVQPGAPRKGFARTIIYSLLDSFGLTVGIVVSLVSITVTMILIAPGIIERIGLIGLGWIVVLFGARSWIKSLTETSKSMRIMYKTLWLMFATVSLFVNLSYVLAVTGARDREVERSRAAQAITEQQTVDSIIAQDPILSSLQDSLTRNKDSLSVLVERFNQLSRQYDEAFRAETVSSLLSAMESVGQDITTVEARVISIEQQIINRRLQVVDPSLRNVDQGRTRAILVSQDIAARDIFYAVPDAAGKGRFIEIIIWLIVLLGLELTVIAVLNEEQK